MALVLAIIYLCRRLFFSSFLTHHSILPSSLYATNGTLQSSKGRTKGEFRYKSVVVGLKPPLPPALTLQSRALSLRGRQGPGIWLFSRTTLCWLSQQILRFKLFFFKGHVVKSEKKLTYCFTIICCQQTARAVTTSPHFLSLWVSRLLF